MKNIKIVDLFCGIGGLSYGLKQAGLSVVAGFDFDESCRFSYETNNNAKFIHKDIVQVEAQEINKYFSDTDIKVLVGCAPCQPFSSYNYKLKNSENKWGLLYEFARLVKEVQPDIVSMENVPQLLKFKQAPVLQDFILNLQQLGYHVDYKIVYAPDYGIAQSRKRLILLASKLGKINLIAPTYLKKQYLSVKDVIGHLPVLSHGETDNIDFIHRASSLSELNLKRIKSSKPGGSWKQDWSDELKLKCHKKKSGQTYSSIYGRMCWDDVAPTMTTFCTGIGNGRFGHPEQDRAISLREAALLQSFPQNYQFAPSASSLKMRDISRHIGNAVPPKLGEVIGKSILEHVIKMKINNNMNNKESYI
jgi:DNA (cytosine-5)-methyltransferase 1